MNNAINETNVHETVFKYIQNNNIQVNTYEDMQNVYLGIIQSGCYFILNRDILVDILTDITFILNPTPDNRQKVIDILSQGDINDDDDVM